MNQVNKTGLVLGGGGARGFFHVGVIKGLQQLKIKIDEIAGTSIGSIVGAIWAANPQIDIEKIALEVDFLKIILLIRDSQKHNFEAVKAYLQKFIPVERFEDLKIPLIFNAADINHREEVVFNKGPLFPGLIASIALPGVFVPIQHQGRYLIDGGIMNNIPATLISDASTLIVSDICGPIKKVDRHSLGLDVLYSSIALLQQQHSLEKIKKLEVENLIYLNLADNEISILDFRKQHFQKLINLGYAAVLAKKSAVISAIKSV